MYVMGVKFTGAHNYEGLTIKRSAQLYRNVKWHIAKGAQIKKALLMEHNVR